MTETTRGTVEMTAAMVISGTIGLFVVLSGQPVMSVVFWRCAFGAATLLAICAALGLLRRDVISRRQIAYAALGGVAIVANWVLLFAAFPRASISIATAVYNTQPFMLVALGAMLFGERITPAKLGWLLVAFAGMLMIVEGKSSAAHSGTDYIGGILLALAAAFFYAIAAIVTKKLKGVPPHLIALIQVVVGVVMLAPFADLGHPPADARSWALLVAIGVIHTGLMYILLYGAIQKLPTNLVGALSFIYPVVAIAADYIAFGQRLQLLQFVGAAAIFVAAAAMTLGWTFWRRQAACPEAG